MGQIGDSVSLQSVEGSQDETFLSSSVQSHSDFKNIENYKKITPKCDFLKFKGSSGCFKLAIHS